MTIHGDLGERAVVPTTTVGWTPRAGIDEKLLEHADAGGLRRTALVRMAPGTSLPTIGNAGVLDVLVLAGELRDDRVRHPAGGYLHTTLDDRLATETGCTLFVKQRPAQRRMRHALDTRRVVFERSHTLGLWAAPLHDDLDGRVVLLRCDAGTTIGRHCHCAGEEFFVLEGEVRDELGSYPTHCWVRQPPGSVHSITTFGGCLFFTFADHLRGTC